MSNKDLIIFDKINKYAKETIVFTQFISYEEFKEDRKTIAACVFNISQIGELVKNIDKKTTDKYKNIKWIAIRGLRNRIVHDYEGIQVDRIWQTIQGDLPNLIEEINKIKKTRTS